MLRRFVAVMLFTASIGAGDSRAQADRCSDTLHPLLAQLSTWCQRSDSGFAYRYCAFVSGASLALGYSPEAGFTLPVRQAALWPGYVFGSFDSLYQPVRAFNWVAAESLLVAGSQSPRGAFVLTDRPVVVTGVDTTLGAPWFFVSMCDSSEWVSAIWDRDDFKRNWWRRMESPGSRVIWNVPDSARGLLGRTVVRYGMRNAVLAARPDSSAGVQYGLAACASAAMSLDVVPGTDFQLRRITNLRQLAAEFLEAHAELWPPDQREPVNLAAYYFRKSAEMWRTISTVRATWRDYDRGQRADWLNALSEWETKAAVALDEIVSARP